MDELLRRLTKAAFRRGVGGEHWAWLIIALSAYALRRVRRSNVDPVTINLKPGERYLVSLSGPEGSAVGSGVAGSAGE